MIALQYKLIKPFVIETAYNDISLEDNEKVIVKPTFLSICKADMRYYLGQRDASTLKKRLPMSLIHEACGEVLYDPLNKLKRGQKVVLLPNIPGKDEYYSENYRLDSLFRSSRADGFMQEILALDHKFLVTYPDRFPDDIMAFTELISVGYHAVNSFSKLAGKRRNHIAVWGDGALSYIVCSLLKCLFPDMIVTVIGINPTKLHYFTFVDETLLVDQVSSEIYYDHCFECVGGTGSVSTIKQMIDTIQPEGMIMLLGVSEEPVPVNTRMVLEKGLTLMGRSRSGKDDFEKVIELLKTTPAFLGRMKHLISYLVEVKSITDVSKAFELAKTADFKVIIKWNI
ncbi:MAG: zinc-binding dehydrogenase [Eubacterium sp.]|nr:zinc-binding dehydrogenase [Eubacterium sp.]